MKEMDVYNMDVYDMLKFLAREWEEMASLYRKAAKKKKNADKRNFLEGMATSYEECSHFLSLLIS